MRVATVSFHGLAPVLVLARLLLGPCPDSIQSWMTATYAWPALYLLLVVLGAIAMHWRVPYPALSPHSRSQHALARLLELSTTIPPSTGSPAHASEPVQSMHAQFADLGPHERHVIDSTTPRPSRDHRAHPASTHQRQFTLRPNTP